MLVLLMMSWCDYAWFDVYRLIDSTLIYLIPCDQNTAVVTNVVSTCYFALGSSQFHQPFHLSLVDGEAYFTPERSAHRIRTKSTRKGPGGDPFVAIFFGRLLEHSCTVHCTPRKKHIATAKKGGWKTTFLLGWPVFRGWSQSWASFTYMQHPRHPSKLTLRPKLIHQSPRSDRLMK